MRDIVLLYDLVSCIFNNDPCMVELDDYPEL